MKITLWLKEHNRITGGENHNFIYNTGKKGDEERVKKYTKYKRSMETRALKLFFLILVSMANIEMFGQCFVSRFNSRIKDSCNSMHIYSRFSKGMSILENTQNVNELWIYNRRKSVLLPESLIQMRLYFINMHQCKNDSIFLKFKNLGSLSYIADTFNRKLLLDLNLVLLDVSFEYGNVNHMISDSNNTLKVLFLVSNQEVVLDSSYLLFKRLHTISLCFNPFLTENFNILSNMENIGQISVYNMDFKNFIFKNTELERLSKFKISFYDCKFTKEQKRQIMAYKNMDIA